MYLSKLCIKNYRCIGNLCLDFNSGLNVLIGENNSGKTTIVDAIRLCLGNSQMRRDIYMSIDDFYVDRNGNIANSVEFDLVFSDPTPEERGVFYEILVPLAENNAELQLHLRYTLEVINGLERIRYHSWGGEKDGQNVTTETLQLLYYVYLGALRNVENDLQPNRGNRLGQLLQKLLPDPDKQKEYANSLQSKIDADIEWRDLINIARKKIDDYYQAITVENTNQSIEISFVPLEYRKLVENLKLYFLENIKTINKKDIIREMQEIEENIHLYFINTNNDMLIPRENIFQQIESQMTSEEDRNKFKSILAKKGITDDYNLVRFEVHQNGLGYNNLIYMATVLGDIVERKTTGIAPYIGLLIEEPEAHLHPQLQDILFNFLNDIAQKGYQIFITSHSPTITAKTQINNLIVLQISNNTILPIPIKKCTLSDDNSKKLERFLDVTKSQLFFSKGVMLVEGISEALLMPAFSRILGYDLDKYGIEVVNISGTSFEPFARLFNMDNGLRMRCSIITDDDVQDDGQKPERIKNIGVLQNDRLKVFLATKTFEYELYQIDDNKGTMNYIYKTLHPKSEIKHSDDFISKLKANKDKAIFAQELSFVLQKDQDVARKFKVPEYIKNAINWVLNK